MELQTIFAYNSLNLLEKAMRNDTIVAKYSYLADGTKLSAVNADDCGFAYRGSFTYREEVVENGTGCQVESARLFRRQDRHIAGQARQQSEERGGLGDV